MSKNKVLLFFKLSSEVYNLLPCLFIWSDFYYQKTFMLLLLKLFKFENEIITALYEWAYSDIKSGPNKSLEWI